MGDTMAKIMKRAAVGFVFLTLLCVVLYIYINNSLVFGLLITFATTAYHFVMRLLVGTVINLMLHNRVDYGKAWFRVSDREQRLYEKLRVKAWKGKMGTYDPNAFDPKKHTWNEIVQATCQAEIVHEVIVVLSFVPVFAAIPFGALPVFVITSLLAACVDGVFVVMQRYNRPRIIGLMEMAERRNAKKRVTKGNPL